MFTYALPFIIYYTASRCEVLQAAFSGRSMITGLGKYMKGIKKRISKFETLNEEIYRGDLQKVSYHVSDDRVIQNIQ